VRFDGAESVLLLTVEDDGPGIPAEKLPWLFKREQGGVHNAGLGLMLIGDVVAAHGGTIDVKSSTNGIDHGTSVAIKLPLK
jgi:two-component system, OmpR family, sensor kinase